MKSIPLIFSAILMAGFAHAIERPEEAGNSGGQAQAVQSVEAAGGGISNGGDKDKMLKADAAKQPQRAWLGVVSGVLPEVARTQLAIPEGEGLMIRGIAPESPAAKADLQANDIVLTVDGKGVTNPFELRKRLAEAKVGDKLKMRVMRAGKALDKEVELAGRPEEILGMNGIAPEAALRLVVPEGLPEGIAEGLPGEVAKAMAQQLQKFDMQDPEALEGLLDKLPDVIGPAEQDRIRKMFGEMRAAQDQAMGKMQPKGGAPMLKLQGGAGGPGMRMSNSMTMRMSDPEGSVEIRSVNGSTEVTAKDKDGNVVYDGPYQTENDKASVPADVRKRLDRLNLDFKNGGMQLRLGGDMPGVPGPQGVAPAEGNQKEPALPGDKASE